MDLFQLTTGSTGSAESLVDRPQTARALGSGTEEVFATPALVALMEAAAVACVDRHLPDGAISLGTQIAIEHVSASAVGAHVHARAELTAIDGRLLSFSLSAHEGDKLIGRGTHTRAVVDRKRFLEKLSTGR